MRVIAGSAKHMPLKTVKGMDTRPTTDRIKETLFNMIQSDLPGCRFLDLFSGSGAIGIEALSRGAEHAVFVEQSAAAAACIRENLEFTHLAASGVLMQCDVLSAIHRLHTEAAFDIVFMDPPYRLGLEREVLEAMAGTGLIDEYTLIIVEASLDTQFDWLESAGYRMKKYKKYKTNAHVFIQKL
ncbi:MAG: 16S rRNA (guanine(966)-N(2))-methyltransferase RsmD [Eubacteriales bacterium]|nr:16S rRNA (guanine(966)-N(2))-methyltransferase RsmD [Eubacteriales bacterium]